MKDRFEQPEMPGDEKPPVTPGPVIVSGPAPASNGAVPPRREVFRVQGIARRPAKRPMAAGTRSAAPGQRRNARPGRPPRPAQPSHSARPAHPTHPTHHYENLVDEGDDGFFARHRAKFVVAVIALLAGGALYFLKTNQGTSTVKAPAQIVSIRLPPLPPPPPPPPPPKVPPPQVQEKMVQETAAEEKPKEEAPKPPAPPQEALGTGIKGDGQGLAGLGGSGNGGGFGGSRSGGGGSKWGWYAGQVQTRVADALRRNSHTKSANMKIQVRIWPDSTGRVTRAKLDGTTGDPKLDAAIQNEVLTGLQLQEPPPAGMPSPIVLRLTARKP